ncbi:MAG: MYG1 family protein [Candidatus Limnocylindria bacterium]
MQVATHDGSFHADEVFAIAALGLLSEPGEVVRTRDPDLLAAADLRVDVGFRFEPSAGDFDHHQRDFDLVRDNGVGYASFGLVWREFGRQICAGDQEVADAVEGSLVQAVDANDTGQRITESLIEGVPPMTVHAVIGGFHLVRPRTDEERERFDAAVELAGGVLAREVESAAAGRRAVHVVRDAIAAAKDPRILFLPDNVPWKQIVATEAPHALFVLYPKRQGFGIETVPAELGTFENRRDLPAAWAGLEDADLARVTGVDDALFCHSKRFLAVARSREGAARLAALALEAASGK